MNIKKYNASEFCYTPSPNIQVRENNTEHSLITVKIMKNITFLEEKLVNRPVIYYAVLSMISNH